MKPSLTHLRVLLACIAWLAQLWIPVSHAASMPDSGRAAAYWCGPTSAPLRASMARLPPEIRQIIEQESAQSAQIEQCAQFCAALGSPVLPEPVAVSVALRAAGLEPLPATPVAPAQHPFGAPLPARGPPSHS